MTNTMSKKPPPKKKSVKADGRGRPSALTQEVMMKLENAWSIGCTDAEAAAFADISESTLYLHCQKDPKLSEKKERLKKMVVLKAKKTIFDNASDPKVATWLLERKCKDEFSTRVETTGADGGAIQHEAVGQGFGAVGDFFEQLMEEAGRSKGKGKQ